eukprot:TRINITY_DN2355_c0_g1_i1.p1 TRINITY_DN2355_c0_g1~~TRINITY_DN2355_c0_g1_i1.p1  ORF type:complete len:413 (-),score=80.72 TRINITY_DN2355_c0_g1_i1:48-1286(-)
MELEKNISSLRKFYNVFRRQFNKENAVILACVALTYVGVSTLRGPEDRRERNLLSSMLSIGRGMMNLMKQLMNLMISRYKAMKGGRKAGFFVLFLTSSSLWFVFSVLLNNVSYIDCFWSLGFLLLTLVYGNKLLNKSSENNENKNKINPLAQSPKNLNISKLSIKKVKKGKSSSSSSSQVSNSSSLKTKFINLLLNWPQQKRITLATTLSLLWGIRLCLYIFIRNVGEGEDFRYKSMRKFFNKKGLSFWWFSLIQTFFLQSALCFIISQPLYSIQVAGGDNDDKPQLKNISIIIGILVWAVGFYFESVSDMQLYKFKHLNMNSGKVLNTGLWHYSRHPNYFGNSLMHYGYYIISLSQVNGWKHVYAPLLMNYLLLNVSGVSLLEKTLNHTKPKYKEYIENTNAFIPWFPKNT